MDLCDIDGHGLYDALKIQDLQNKFECYFALEIS